MSLKPDPKPKGKGLTPTEIENLIEEVKIGIGIALTKAAYNNYVATSFETLANALKVKIIPDEIYEIGKGSEFFKIITKENKVPPLTPSIVSDIKEVYDTPARDYAQAYADDLAKGGRFINKPVWGNYDKDLGYRPYLGYEREWTPWLETYSEQSRAEITRIIHEGDKAGLWPSRWEGRGPYVDPDDLRWDYPGYEKNSLADQLEGYFSNRRSHASTIARTETQNQRAVVRRERWDQIGYTKYKWICAGGRAVSKTSPCSGLCAQFCGKVFSREDLPNNGEKIHPNCLCQIVAILERDSKNMTVDSPFPDVSKSDLDSMRREGDKGNAWDIYNPYAIF